MSSISYFKLNEHCLESVQPDTNASFQQQMKPQTQDAQNCQSAVTSAEMNTGFIPARAGSGSRCSLKESSTKPSHSPMQ